MSTFNVILVAAIIGVILVVGLLFTISKFRSIESGKTDRRKHIEEDMEVEDRKDD